METATRFMGEKDEEIQRLEEQISSMKMQYARISRTGAPMPHGEVRLEGNETLPLCGSGNSGCNVV